MTTLLIILALQGSYVKETHILETPSKEVCLRESKIINRLRKDITSYCVSKEQK